MIITRIKLKDNHWLFLTLLISISIHLPFLLSDISFNNDAAGYSHNIEKPFFSQSYDVQLPGYILYIYTGRLLYLFTRNTILIQHIINIVLILLITFFSFKLLKRLNFNNYSAFFYPLLLSVNNIIFLGGITGGNRLFLALCSLILIYLSVIILETQKSGLLILFGSLFAFFAGFRQDLLFYMLPLFIYLWIRIKHCRPRVLSIIIFILINISWFVPLMFEYGGPVKYFNLLTHYDAVKNTSILFSTNLISPLLNMIRIFLYLFNAFLFIFPLFIYTAVKKQFHISRPLWIILVWAFFPALIFQMLVHNGNFVQLSAFMIPLFIFLIISLPITTNKRRIAGLIIFCLVLFQFFGLKMFKAENIYQKAANILWLQYTYDGARSGETLRLKYLEEDIKNE